MPVVKLTQTFVDRLRAPHPSGRQVIHFDTVTRGFGVQVSGTTSAVDYIAQRDLPNAVKGAKKKTRRVNLGPVNAKRLTIDVARQLAEDQIDAIRRGIDPRAKADPAPEPAMFTLREAKDRYFLAKKKLSEGSRRAYGQIERHLADWMDKPLSDISNDMVEQRHQKIADDIAAKGGRYDGKTTANVTMVTLRVLWRFAARRVALPICPVIIRLQNEDQWFPSQRRTTRVAAEKLPAFFQFVRHDAGLSQVQRDFLLMLLFTGFRKTETARLRWADVDLVQRVITLPAPSTKTKHMAEIPMSDFVRDLLIARRALGTTSEFVFESRAGQCISGATDPLKKVAKATGVIVTAHSLRRTFLKVGASARVSVVYLKAMANHAIAPDQTVEYIAPTLEDLREPAQQVADRMQLLCGAQPVAESKVVNLR